MYGGIVSGFDKTGAFRYTGENWQQKIDVASYDGAYSNLKCDFVSSRLIPKGTELTPIQNSIIELIRIS